MVDVERNLVTLKIFRDDKRWADQEQHRLSGVDEKVTAAEFFRLLRQAYAKEPKREPPKLPKRYREALEKLPEILAFNGDDDGAIDLVCHQIENAWNRLCRSSGSKR